MSRKTRRTWKQFKLCPIMTYLTQSNSSRNKQKMCRSQQTICLLKAQITKKSWRSLLATLQQPPPPVWSSRFKKDSRKIKNKILCSPRVRTTVITWLKICLIQGPDLSGLFPSLMQTTQMKLNRFNKQCKTWRHQQMS